MRVAVVCVKVWSCDVKDHGAWEVDQSVVEGRDRLEVEVVGRLVEDQQVGSFDHDARQACSAPFLLLKARWTSFLNVFTAEEHFAQKPAHVNIVHSCW